MSTYLTEIIVKHEMRERLAEAERGRLARTAALAAHRRKEAHRRPWPLRLTRAAARLVGVGA